MMGGRGLNKQVRGRRSVSRFDDKVLDSERCLYINACVSTYASLSRVI